jgi:hypothetical protein
MAINALGNKMVGSSCAGCGGDYSALVQGEEVLGVFGNNPFDHAVYFVLVVCEWGGFPFAVLRRLNLDTIPISIVKGSYYQ